MQRSVVEVGQFMLHHSQTLHDQLTMMDPNILLVVPQLNSPPDTARSHLDRYIRENDEQISVAFAAYTTLATNDGQPNQPILHRVSPESRHDDAIASERIQLTRRAHEFYAHIATIRVRYTPVVILFGGIGGTTEGIQRCNRLYGSFYKVVLVRDHDPLVIATHRETSLAYLAYNIVVIKKLFASGPMARKCMSCIAALYNDQLR